MKRKKWMSLGLAACMTASLIFAGCGGSTQTTQATSAEASEVASAATQEPEETETAGAETTAAGESGDAVIVEVYDVAANYQGMQTGWFAKLVREKFGLELNIFAPNTSGDANGLYQTRSSSGHLGDIILLDNADFVDCIDAGLIQDISDEIWEYPNLSEYQEQIEALNTQLNDEGKIYGIPTEMTNTTPDQYSESDPASAPCLPWDYYRELGCPELKDLDDLLDVLEQMQEAHPTNDAGDSAYAISLWSDWDGFGMENVLQTLKWYGQEAKESLLIGTDNSVMPLIDENGGYYKMLKFFFEANQRGLVDPDSSVQDWTTLDEGKIRTYRTYLLWYNWAMKLSSINLTEEDNASGKGFINVPVEDLKLFQVSDSYYGTGRVWGIGSKVDAETKERIMEFFDWMASPEGATYMWVGVEGLTYDVGENGRFVTTEDSTAYVGENKEVPEEWGGGGYADGNCKLNQYIVSSMALNPNNGEPYSRAYWSSELEKPQAARYAEWTEKYGSATQTEYFLDKGMMEIVPNVNVILESDTTDIALIRSQCGQEITDASWKMVFAQDEAEFDRLWEEMKGKLEGLGWDTLVEFDMEKYQKMIDARVAAME